AGRRGRCGVLGRWGGAGAVVAVLVVPAVGGRGVSVGDAAVADMDTGFSGDGTVEVVEFAAGFFSGDRLRSARWIRWS
ncbi:MAG: hypothetical protein LH616_16770, partial [Ilumatobacteraceae bacterium]|nr:hypothetical protein [Ilumatobacteraceae bacterium]